VFHLFLGSIFFPLCSLWFFRACFIGILPAFPT
jgi:hypothetical protein